MMVMCASSSAAGVHHRKGKGVTMSDVKVRLKKLQDNAIGYDLIDILEWGFDDKGQLQSIVYIGYSIEDEEWGLASAGGYDLHEEIMIYYAAVHPKPDKRELTYLTLNERQPKKEQV